MTKALDMTLRIGAGGPGGIARLNAMRFLADPARYALDQLAPYAGPVVPITCGNGAIAVVRGTEAVHRFFTDAEALGRPRDGVLALPQGHPWSLMTESLITVNGPSHRRRRKVVYPAMAGRALEAYRPVFRSTVGRSRFAADTVEPFDIVTEFREIALENMLLCLLGLEVGDANCALAERLTGLLGAMLSPIVLVLRGEGRWTPYGRCLDRLRQTYGQLAAIIERRRVEPVRPDVLSMLCHATTEDGSPLTTPEIAGELTGLFVAGYETTASAMSWAMLTGLHDPAAARSCLPGVLDETQRLIPTAPVSLPRRALQDIMFDGTTLVPTGTIVFVSPPLEHRAPEVFPDPHAFRPERWDGFRPPQNAFLPFGAGHRRCIGAKFAESQVRTTLELIFGRCEWDLLTARIDYGIKNGIVSLPRSRVLVRRGRGTLPPRITGTLTRFWRPEQRNAATV